MPEKSDDDARASLLLADYDIVRNYISFRLVSALSSEVRERGVTARPRSTNALFILTLRNHMTGHNLTL